MPACRSGAGARGRLPGSRPWQRPGPRARCAPRSARNAHVAAVIEQRVAGGGTGVATFDIEVVVSHPLVTLTSMIGPSPAWFVGIGGLSLLDDRQAWHAERHVDLFPYDAGTEDGAEFRLSNPDTRPRGVITSIRGTGKFSAEPMARLRFVLRLGQVTGVTVTTAEGRLAVSWDAVPGADGYRVQWKSGAEEFDATRAHGVTGGAVTSHVIADLDPGVEHSVRVVATRGTLEGSPSEVETGTPLHIATETPVPQGPTRELLGGGDRTSVYLPMLFGGGHALAYEVASSAPALVAVALDGDRLVLASVGDASEGVATVTVTATDPEGRMVTMSFRVRVTPLPSGVLRGWRRALFGNGAETEKPRPESS